MSDEQLISLVHGLPSVVYNNYGAVVTLDIIASAIELRFGECNHDSLSDSLVRLDKAGLLDVAYIDDMLFGVKV